MRIFPCRSRAKNDNSSFFYRDKYHNFPSEFSKLWLNLCLLNKSDNCFRNDSSLTQSFKDLSWLESQS